MMADNKQIPFRVSARTARLIGRENIATAKGAIIELVKNGYDADSPTSIVFFDNYYSKLQTNLTESYLNELIERGIDKKLLHLIYEYDTDTYKIKSNVDDDNIKKLKEKLSKLSSLYIIDSGEGMTQKIIRENWMTIGTDNKAHNYLTKTGRVKAGAKGIGRFALDKLGSKAEMLTFFNPKNHEPDIEENGEPTSYIGYKWQVNWEDFEGEFKTIENVSAQLTGVESSTLHTYLTNVLPTNILKKIPESYDYEYGTILKITELRDHWDNYFVEQVYSDLEVLVPPRESNEFSIYLFSSLNPEDYGEVLGSLCDDFDYKIIAKADDKQNVEIKIIRNEYDTSAIPIDFFTRPSMKLTPYTRDDFIKGFWETNRSFSQLLPGYSEIDTDKTFDDIGLFEFTFYYMKKTYTTPDAERFFYKSISSSARKDWLQKFGGIKLFRDNFRVRPYGEIKDVAFDWLGLGNRKAASPAGVAKKDGRYRVEPENVAGAIKISRLTNVNFEDKSSREGLQENKTFQIFKELIASIINIFESDRSYIAREMDDYDDQRYSDIRSRQEAEDIARKILEKSREKKYSGQNTKADSNSKPDSSDDLKDKQLAIIAELNEKKDEEIERLKEEQKVLRGLASSGIVLASFSHDLSKLNSRLESRFEKLKKLISEKIDEVDYQNVENRKNPFYLMQNMKDQDVKLKSWLAFSLGAARKDKRKRKQLFLRKYFSDFKIDWNSVLEDRGVVLNINSIEDLDLRVFEIDFDSIFNNLLVNTIDAFNSSGNHLRQISISVTSNDKEIVIIYSDNGPGISKDIDNPEKIFEPLFTTKRNPHSGEEEGTGLGMWLVKSIVEENDGNTKLLYPESGFSIRISFPVKYKR
ncbi:HAMP domain-containing histidine kinase [Yersinia enterocolitica]|nr:HAMP domain-containing histidine kinase [Yersinia enterocolitica]ELI8407628.1 HAMP domain-containing histidine kinase [Yersinia enterocolitica]HDM8309778.1 HAMP domain-containing histidine kinase [Yersinia enterocolitica]HDV7143371.1 HAMP domain-containing histidine kinase [Yersinia enterocolitica]